MQRGVKIHISVCQQSFFLWYAAQVLFQTGEALLGLHGFSCSSYEQTGFDYCVALWSNITSFTSSAAGTPFDNKQTEQGYLIEAIVSSNNAFTHKEPHAGLTTWTSGVQHAF